MSLGAGFEMKDPSPIASLFSLLSLSLFVCVVLDVSSQMLLQLPCLHFPVIGMSFYCPGSVSSKDSSLLLALLGVVFFHSNIKVINTEVGC